MPQVTTSSFNLGYPPFANWINNFDDNNAPRPAPHPVPGKMKTVFLPELTGGYVEEGVPMKTTLNYYWNTYPQEFTRCPIVDTQGDLTITLNLLNQYYNWGFRYFVGFSRSTILNGVLDWFNEHPLATGISSTSTDPTLNIPKNIYRMTPADNYMLNSIQQYLTSATDVYYVYTANENAAENLIPYLTTMLGSNLHLKPIASNADFDALITLNGIPLTDVVLTYNIINRNYYLNLFTEGTLTFACQQYDILGGVDPVISAPILNDVYNTVIFKGAQTSILWRNGYNYLGADSCSLTALNILTLINTFVNNKLVDNINSHFNTMQFDPVTKDTIYPTFLISTYSSGSFRDTYLYAEDAYLGTYTATLTGVSQTPSEVIPISANAPFSGKAIALLELSNVAYVYDQIIRDSIYYCWYKDSSLPKFPIIDTEAVVDITPLLDQYYADGYRVFLGMSTPIVLQNSKNWFASHPDAVGISQIGAGAIDNVPSNVFRIQVSDSSIIGMFANDILTPAAPYGIYYVYTESSITALSIKALLQYLYGAQVYTQAINDTTYPLDYTTLNPFFTGIQANSVVVTFLTSNQSYADAFNDPLMNPVPAKQYLTNISTAPTITNVNAQNALDMKLFDLTETFPNTSNLWNEVRLYLTNKYGVDTTSFETINALKMIQYILAGKDTKLLGSHSGVLQFNPAAPPSNPPPPPPRLLKYPSALLTQYQKTQNTFVNYSITFQDPLLGNFTASFV